MKYTPELLRELGFCPDTGRYLGKGALAPAPNSPLRPNKYGAKRTVGGDGRVYDSAGEAREAGRLALRQQAGEIVAAIPQVSLPCGLDDQGRARRYRADWLEIREILPGNDGWFVGRLVDYKGADTEASQAKRSAIHLLYSIIVRIVKR